MFKNFGRLKGHDRALTLFNATIDANDLRKEQSVIKPAKDVFGSVGLLLKMIRV